MRYLLLLFPFVLWAVLPRTEMEHIHQKYIDANSSSVVSHKFSDEKYYIVNCVDERFFPDDILEEEKPYLKACVKQLLLAYMQERNPRVVSLEVSGLLHGAFWMDKKYFHHLAQVPAKQVKPIFKTPDTLEKKQKKTSSVKATHIASFTIEPNDVQRELQEKIVHLETKSKQHPKNLKLLQNLRALYKQLGDTEGYASVNDRIMLLKMDI